MQHEFEDSVAAFEDDLDELRDLRRRTAEVVARLGASVPELLAATQKLRRHADNLEDELREASGEAPHPTTPRRRKGRQDAALTRAASSLERAIATPNVSAHVVITEAELLEKVAHDEVHKKVAHAREKFNMACCPLLQILQLEPVRRRIFAFIPGGSSRNQLRRLARRPTNTADSMRALARCRRVCRAFRRWLNDAITSVPRVIVCGGAALGSGAQDGRRVGPQRTAESLDLISLQWSPLPPLRAKRCGAGATALGDGRLLVVGGKSSEHLLLRSAEIYDPQSASWSPAPDMVRAPSPTRSWDSQG